MKKIIVKALVLSTIGLTFQASALTSMDDLELSQVEGQALLSMNVTQGVGSQSTMGFYRLGIDAEISLNANIKKLQLGCGGSKGAGACDIDIDNISLVGINSVVGTDGTSSYANSDFVLNNPFVEFAIDNPNSASTRSVAGFRLGALSALGMMSIGGNKDTTILSDDTGINKLSGDIGVRVTNALMNNVNACLSGLNGSKDGCLINLGNGGLLKGSALVADYNTTLIANRSSSFSLLGMTAQSDEHLLNLKLPNVNMNDIPYATVHKLVIADANGNPTSNASLSLQSKDIYWQNISDGSWKSVAAKEGWWMSIPTTQFDGLVAEQPLFLNALGAIAGSILNTEVNIKGIDLGQMPISNCFGGYKFC